MPRKSGEACAAAAELVAPPKAAEGRRFCKSPPETRACRKAVARGVQGKKQRTCLVDGNVARIKLEGGAGEGGMVGCGEQAQRLMIVGQNGHQKASP